ncbi:2TM domain-containing protein [Comamonas sp. GB3 AK4-5]|uniref:2TM domain-containing protein n=1 Tax=Comamonas sp. GB3 AK4-5 TaxID=3231487 RepID=UPI00351DFA92
MPHTASLERLARQRTHAKLGWWGHAMLYLLVNLGLALLCWHQGRQWFVYPLLGWGIGLLAHGLSMVFMRAGSPWFERQVARERARLQASAASMSQD